MSDAQDAAWRLRQRRHADQTRRRLTRIFDADGDGLSDSTLPMFGQRTAGRQGPPPSPISLPVGESITVNVPPQEIPVGGKFLDFGEPVAGPVRAGFTGYTGSGSGMPASVTAYYAAALTGMWEESWEGGGRIEWWVGDQPIGEYRGPHRWRTLEREERRVGVVGRGTNMRLFVDHEDTAAHDWSGGMASFELVDMPGLAVGDPIPPSEPIDASFLTSDGDVGTSKNLISWQVTPHSSCEVGDLLLFSTFMVKMGLIGSNGVFNISEPTFANRIQTRNLLNVKQFIYWKRADAADAAGSSVYQWQAQTEDGNRFGSICDVFKVGDIIDGPHWQRPPVSSDSFQFNLEPPGSDGIIVGGVMTSNTGFQLAESEIQSSFVSPATNLSGAAFASDHMDWRSGQSTSVPMVSNSTFRGARHGFAFRVQS